ncbi:plasmid partitioning protein RepB [uncultured Marivita sp.]|uniref:plasmid partitioning protein RepB n=1 Tax=uncultured Marivita sp. TaxID=888080 RepID=UPI00261F5689|nr:plasmid partitioning protein RepB [uncultured Marivita sp.]
MARKGILTTEPNTSPKRRAPEPVAPRGAVGALQSSLTKLQENAVQDIAAHLIDDAGIEDRLAIDPDSQAQLKASLKTYGQQVPVLLRPNLDKPGRYEIVYGRRRLAALRDLGMPVKAMVRNLDDHALVLAQGQENTARQDLSFIEKASFATQLAQSDYDRQTIAAALSIDLPMVSRLLKIGTELPLEFLRRIGSAPGIGRDRWTALVKMFNDDPNARRRAYETSRSAGFDELPSDDRFEKTFTAAANKRRPADTPPTPKARTLRGRDGTAIADIRSTRRGVTLNIPARDGFDAWIAEHAETLISDLHDRWQKERTED